MVWLFPAFFLTAKLASSSYTTEVLQPAFLKSFTDRCTAEKYPFIPKFYERQNNPGDRYVHFVFHEHRFRNGGFGDRLAGLVNAAAIALRFDRQLLIESRSGFEELFRPYHPNITHSTAFSATTSIASDYLWQYCTDNDDKIIPNYHRSNWSSWTAYNSSLANSDDTEYDLYNCINIGGKLQAKCGMEEGDKKQAILKIRGNRAFLCKWRTTSVIPTDQLLALGMTQDADLFEMAGCILRLVMWPTQLLWDYVDEQLTSEALRLAKLEGKEKALVKENFWDYQIGVHFRCGDYSYAKKGSREGQCVHVPGKVEPNMARGSPVDLGLCAAQVIQNMSSSSDGNKTDKRRLHTDLQANPSNVLLFVASDNHGSALQISNTTQRNQTIISPYGCHIEMDESYECTIVTVGNCDVLITQAESDPSKFIGPVSAFSRYAMVYGLKKDIWRNPKECSAHFDSAHLAATRHGNWIC